ncbi:MAG: glycosyltransferase family 39 protein, partial [Chloroflexota bacterium]|nr:glycosyltransferase family 39 protein [Chloroflexota bacterium]
MRKILDVSAKLNLALVVVLSLGLLLRVWGINFGLPYTTAPDDPTHFKIALGIFQTGDLNPHWLNYPSLMFYLNALALVPYYLVGKVAGVFASPSDVPAPEVVTMGVGLLSVPSEFLYSRLLTAAFGIASIGLTYLVARQMRLPRWGAVLAALLLAVSPAAVYNSHLIRPDTFATFFGLLSVFWALKILDDPKPWNYVWSGIGAGLAVSSKYNMPLIVLPMITAHFLRYGFEGFRRKTLYLGIIVSMFACLATTPYMVLDFPLFRRGFGFEVTAQAEGHAGAEGNAFPWYLSFLWSTESGLVVAALIQAVRLVWTRSKSGIVLLAFPGIYFIFINLFVVRNDRTILPMLPYLHVLAAMFGVGLYDRLTQSRRALALPGALATCLVLFYFPLQTSVASDIRLTQPDGRDTARAWIQSNLPSGTRLAQEAYTPYVDTRRYVVQGVYGIVDHSPDWYVQNGFEYLILSQGTYGRFFAEPDRYGEWIAKYNQ